MKDTKDEAHTNAGLEYEKSIKDLGNYNLWKQIRIDRKYAKKLSWKTNQLKKEIFYQV